MNNYKIAVLSGDGIGPEIIREGYKILEVVKKKYSLNLILKEYDVGGKAIDKYGIALPEETLIGCKNSHAILFGAVGGPKWHDLPTEEQPERAALLPLRKFFNLFSNLRPAKLHKDLVHLSPLRSEIASKGFDILCIRELTSGVYYGRPKGRTKKNGQEFAFDTAVYYNYEIERIARIAFKLARTRKKSIVSIDKANVLETSILWREVVNKVSKEYSDVNVKHLYIDNACMQIIKNPQDFDIILSSNLFGDILSDECAMLTGSIGMLPSASLNNMQFGLYEPAGGSAPDIAGKNIANPIALILSLSMLFKYSLQLYNIAEDIEWSVNEVLKNGYRTFDITNQNNYISTQEMGNKIAFYLQNKE
ncbi:3-isopropylmalate dehydrogenase [Buchnera aphidicola (Eriosoma lanigerum)]